MKYTFFWRDGKRQVAVGRSPADALMRSGYGQGALAALDFYSKGDDKSFKWNSEKREWEHRPPVREAVNNEQPESTGKARPLSSSKERKRSTTRPGR